MLGRGTRARRFVRRAVVGSAWGFTGALLAIVLGSVLFVSKLHDRADMQREAQVVASELQQDAAELRVAQDALMTGELSVGEAGAEFSDEFGDLYATTAVLEELGDDAIAAAIEQDLQTFDSALGSQLAALDAGQPDAAAKVRGQRTVPALGALDDRVDAADDYYEVAAAQSTAISDVGLWVSTLLAGLAIGGLSWRYERVRRASQRGLERRLRARVAEVAEITERHRQLEAMKYSFVSAVSHELRTPLTAIQGSLELLEDGVIGTLPEPALKVVAVAARGTRRLARLVENVIDLERLESGHFAFNPVPHDLQALLVETVESLTPLTQHAGITLVLHETHGPDVLCDGDRVLQALVNLVGNAIKFTSPGGSIHLEAVNRGDEVEVTVRDEGRGIPADQLDAVFDRFHQVNTKADQHAGGAGLGLTITRHIIEAQGGRIWVESEYGSGTEFRFTLPLILPGLRYPAALVEPKGQSVDESGRTLTRVRDWP